MRTRITSVLVTVTVVVLIVVVATQFSARGDGSRTDVTKANIRDILLYTRVYCENRKAFPDPEGWKAALKSGMSNQKDAEWIEKCSKDGWGSLLRCEIIGDGKNAEFRCWSVGPNLVDEHGEGDDIVGILRGSEILWGHGQEQG